MQATIITGAGGSGVLLSDACHDNGLHLMEVLAAKYRWARSAGVIDAR